MNDQEEIKIYRHSWRSAMLYCLVPAVFIAFSTLGLIYGPTDWTTYVLYGMTALSILGFVEHLLERLIIYPDRIIVVHNFKKTTITKEDFQHVTWEKGCDTTIQIGDGKWISICHPGATALGICNTLRAWKKRS